MNNSVNTTGNTEQEFMKIYENYRNTTSEFILISAISLVAFCAIGIVLLGGVLLTALYVRKWEPILTFTYSLVAVDLSTLIVFSFGIFANTLKLFGSATCLQLGIEAVRVAGIFITLTHVSVLALQHLLASTNPVHFRVMSEYIIKPGIALICGVPLLCSLVWHYTLPLLKGTCSLPYYRSDSYRLTQTGLYSLPIVVTLVIYLKMVIHLIDRPSLMRNRAGTITTNCTGSPSSNGSACTQIDKSLSPDRPNSRLHILQRSVVSKSMVARNRQVRRRRQRTRYLALLILAVFLFCWLPGVISFALMCGDCLFPVKLLMAEHPWILAIGSVSTNFLMCLKFVLNAFVYPLRMPDIQKALRTMLRSKKKRQSKADVSRFRRGSRSNKMEDVALTNRSALMVRERQEHDGLIKNSPTLSHQRVQLLKMESRLTI